MPLKKITASRTILDEQTGKRTGKDYTVLFDPEVGVTKILSICAFQMNDDRANDYIDITLYETQFNDAEAFIDTMFPWDDLDGEIYVEEPAPKRDQFFNMAADIVRRQAKSLRH